MQTPDKSPYFPIPNAGGHGKEIASLKTELFHINKELDVCAAGLNQLMIEEEVMLENSEPGDPSVKRDLKERIQKLSQRVLELKNKTAARLATLHSLEEKNSS